MQQWQKLRAQGIANPNPQQQMLDDLATFLKPHIQEGNEVIIMVDNDFIGGTSDDDDTAPPPLVSRSHNKFHIAAPP
jgi:hypothetical protein